MYCKELGTFLDFKFLNKILSSIIKMLAVAALFLWVHQVSCQATPNTSIPHLMGR